jgi:DNA-binding NtrC family response regulator
MQRSDDILENLLARQISLFELQNEYYKCALRHFRGNRTHAARLLGVGVSTIKARIRRFEWESYGQEVGESPDGHEASR